MIKSLFTLLFTISLLSPNISAQADQKDPRLPALFEQLLSVSPGPHSIILERRIWHIWTENKNKTITQLMIAGDRATQTNHFSQALKSYTQVVQKDPNFAEGWNKRALTHYLMGQYEASLSDIRRTLSLEPRHFGALSGRGLIYAKQRKWALAKKAFRGALKIHPTMRGPRINLLIIEKQDGEEDI